MNLKSITVQLLEQQMNFSYKTVKHHIQTIWDFELKKRADEDLGKIQQTTGYLLRGDHTYKYVKPLGGYDFKKKTWVC